MEKEEIIKLAIEKFGEEAQINMAIEECAELIVALNHYRRHRVGKIDVCEEIADVQIMIKQLSEIFGRGIIAMRFDFKMNRLEDRLKNI